MTVPSPCSRHRTITLVTKMRPGRTPYNRLLFLGASLVPRTIGISLLGSVHTTRWSILSRIPYNGPPQVRARPEHPLMLWESDYTGLPAPYIASFVRVLARQIDWTWRTSYGFPGVRTITPLAEYIAASSRDSAYSYAACPDASERMVTSALEVAREHPFLCVAAQQSAPAEFGVVYRGFLRRRQADL